jgi:hypothetical protein
MKAFNPALDPSGRRSLDHELAIVLGAIGLVAAGFSDRVTCTSLSFASQLLPEAELAAGEAGVRVTPIWTLDDAAAGVTVERVRGA